MNPADDKLAEVLRQWRAAEVPGNFEANVWRRIRTAAPVAEPGLSGWLRRALWHPALSLGAAAALGVAIGVWGGFFSATPVPAEIRATHFLSPGTLAGTYAQLTTGDKR